MKQEIREIIEEMVPLADPDSDFLFAELDSLGITAILMSLASKYNVELEAVDATPKNFRNLDSLVEMVKSKMK